MTLLLLHNLGFAGGAAASGYSFTGDLTTVFRQYVDALQDTAIVASDSTTLVDADVDTMVAGTVERADRNTQYNEYLH
jgi:hypothetical protein